MRPLLAKKAPSRVWPCSLDLLQNAPPVFVAADRDIHHVPNQWPGYCRQGRFNWDDVLQVFAFGDSYSFVQGTAGLANFSFIGDAFNLNFSPEALLSDLIIPKNTSSDGSNWLEFITGCFSGSPLQCRRQLWDFAFAGADITADLLPLHHNFTVPLVDQVRQFVDSDVLGSLPEVPHAARMTAWWIGINDTGDVLGLNITDLASFWAQEMISYFTAVEAAYAAGLRGTYLFLNVPPEDRSPDNLGTSRAAAAAASIAGYNAALATAVARFATAHPDMHVITFDAHTWFEQALNSATALGFTNITGFCECTDPSFFWFNTGHPTERVHRLLADAIESRLVAESE